MASNLSDFASGLQDFGPTSQEHFDFTPLFEESILSILPSALLLLVLPFRIWSLRNEPPKVLKSARLLYGNKLAFLVLFAVLQTTALIIYATNPSVSKPVTLAASTLVVADAFGLLLLSHVEHIRSIRPSSIINIYLFITIIFDIARTRTLWIQHGPKPLSVLFSFTLSIKLMIAVTEAVGKRRILLSRYQNVSPEATSGMYGRAFFWWLNRIMGIGFRRVIRDVDLFAVEHEISASVLKNHSQLLWNKVNKAQPHALFWTTFKVNRVYLLLGIFPRLCLIGFRYAQPFLLSRTVDFVDSKESDDIGWGLTGAFFVVFLGTAVTGALYSHMSFRFITAMRGTLVTMIYAKTVDLSITALDESAAITLMSNDTEAICASLQNLHEMWAAPIELAIALWLIQRQLGVSFLAPAAVAIISTICTIWISKYMGAAQKIWIQGIQTRVAVSTSMLGSMKAVKILGFIPKIAEIVHGLRVKELRLSFVFRRLLTLSAFFSNTMRTLTPLVTLAFFVPFDKYLGRDFTATSIFTALSLISMLNVPISALLRTIPSFRAGLACFARIQTFLISEYRQTNVLPLISTSAESGSDTRPPTDRGLPGEIGFELQSVSRSQAASKILIDVRNASFAWSRSGTAQVNDVTFSIRRGDFVFVIGPVGCGKSTLLKGLMSETPSLKGFVYSDLIESAFADQSPWIQNATIRQNVVGPASFDNRWYEEVIKACALNDDIAAMPSLHDTTVGSRGISLSGGQKQRVGLARAVYSKKQLIMIDDGFSGLDTATEETVFVNLFGRKGLFRRAGITAILVTHAVARLPYADHIIALNAAGQVAEQGKFEDLKHSGGYVEGLATKHKYESGSGGSEDVEKITPDGKRISPPAAVQKKGIQSEKDDLGRRIGEWSTYKYYFGSIGWRRTLLSLFFLVLSGTSTKLTELLITYWTDALSTHGSEVNALYLGLYGMLAGVGTIFWVVATYHFFLFLVPVSAEKLHARLLGAVMNAPLYFFTSTDTGVTTNRFSQDMSIVDNDLPFALIDLIVALVQAVMGAVLMCFVAGYFALTLPPVLLVVWMIQKYYLRTSRQVRLLDLEAKSPLYSHFIESLSGLATIRAFGWSDAFVEQNLALLDHSQKPFYLLFCIQRWLALVLDLMVTVLAVIMMVLVVKLRNSVDSGFVGLAILNVISFSQSLAWIIRQWTALETSIGAISRLKSFTTTTPSENLAGEDQAVPDSWPENGGIEFRNLSASYELNGPKVLNGIDMTIKPGEKIGVCGRTGSGKSSLIMSIFRLLEIPPESSILIDGIDITTIPRQTTRSRLNAIPQDPFFLKGSIRLNASPNNSHNDDEIVQALTLVTLWPLIISKGGLDAALDPTTFSQGQQQLFCLARAILRKSKIVVLDEVSSNIDVETDRLVQKIVRDEFKDATIIAVAHRLDTIMDFDRVAVVSEGRVVEFENPDVLMARESAFRELYNS